jgi:hypothetical protein
MHNWRCQNYRGRRTKALFGLQSAPGAAQSGPPPSRLFESRRRGRPVAADIGYRARLSRPRSTAAFPHRGRDWSGPESRGRAATTAQPGASGPAYAQWCGGWLRGSGVSVARRLGPHGAWRVGARAGARLYHCVHTQARLGCTGSPPAANVPGTASGCKLSSRPSPGLRPHRTLMCGHGVNGINGALGVRSRARTGASNRIPDRGARAALRGANAALLDPRARTNEPARAWACRVVARLLAGRRTRISAPCALRSTRPYRGKAAKRAPSERRQRTPFCLRRGAELPGAVPGYQRESPHRLHRAGPG